MSDLALRKFSIIIPYYNTPVEIFNRCIQSILNQEYSNYEVIVVDDGSSKEFADNLSKICDNSKIKLYRKNNEGVSVARNFGVDAAMGEYITFVDSDDEVLPGFLTEANWIINKYNTELIIGGLVCDNEKYNEATFDDNDATLYKDTEVKQFKKHIIDEWLMIEGGGHINRGPVCRVVAKELAISCPFDKNIKIGEDMLWNLCMLNRVKDFCLAKRVWYKYRYNPDSATHRYNENILEIEEAELKALKQYIDIDNTEEYVAYNNHVFECLKRVHECYLSSKWKDDKKKGDEQKRIYSSPIWSCVLKYQYFKLAPIKHKLKVILFRMRLLFTVWDFKEEIST